MAKVWLCAQVLASFVLATALMSCSGGKTNEGDDTSADGGPAPTDDGTATQPSDGSEGDTTPSSGSTDSATSEDSETPDTGPVTLNGAVDKGPFVLGSSVAISPVDATTGSPSGQVFNTQTISDLGEFEVEFDYRGLVSLEANGFYYNEATGALSSAPITLRAYYQVESGGTHSAYINLITHLSYNRVKGLISGGVSFWDAVTQAEEELRLALEIGPPGFDPQASGIEMNISGGASLANAYLFAVSSVLAERARLEGGPIDAAFQELLNTIAVDFADDGDISDEQKVELWEAQFALDVDKAMMMLSERLADVGSAAVVPDINLILDLDRDGAVNAEDCLIYDPTRFDGNADLDGDGFDHFRCGGEDHDDNCADCNPAGVEACGAGQDHDGDALVDEFTGCGACVPGTPAIIGSLQDTSISDIFVRGNTVFAVGSEGLVAFDISNPSAIAGQGQYMGMGGDADLVVYGDRAYLGQEHGFQLVDISDVANMQSLSFGEFPADSMAVFGDLLFLGTAGIIDVSNPTMPMPMKESMEMQWDPSMGGPEPGGEPDHTTEPEPGPEPDPDMNPDPGMEPNPDMVWDPEMNPDGEPMPDPGMYPETEGEEELIFLNNRLLYVLSMGRDLSIIDFSDFQNPIMAGSAYIESNSVEFDGGATALFATDDAVYIAGWNGLTIVDVSDPASPIPAGRVDGLMGLQDVFAVDRTVYVAGDRGLFVVDASDLNAPQVVAGPIGEDLGLRSVFVSSDKAVVGGDSGLHIIDLDCGGETMIVCGNARVDWGEGCDSADFAGQSCNTFGYSLGEVTCNADCTIDDSACTNCGNNNVEFESGEECDGTNLNDQDCHFMGFGDGTLTCNDQCLFDTSQCYYVCGDWRLDPGEECETNGGGAWSEDELDGHTCQNFGFANESGLRCSSSCSFDTTECFPVCGNGMLEPKESCEADQLDDMDCTDFGFLAPEGLACTDCEFDLAGCTATCGNSVIEPVEDCEGADLGEATCADLGYVNPDGLACSDCMFDDSNCQAVCGNSVVEPGEGCDDGDADGSDGCSADCQVEENWQCLGQPSICDPCGDFYHGESCDRCVVLVDSDEKIENRDGRTWQSALETIGGGVALAGSLGEGCEVWVKAGVYSVYQESPDNSLVLPDGVRLFGGFSGTEAEREERDLSVNETIIDGAGPGFSHVQSVIRANGTTDAIVDGFTVRGGRQQNAEQGGAGASLFEADVTFANCVFGDNRGSGDGGAIYASNSTLVLEGCTVSGSESFRGGGLFSQWSNVTAVGTAFIGNNGSETGGGVFIGDQSQGYFDDCTFSENHSFNGAGIAVDWNANVSVVNSVFKGNRADESGGAIQRGWDTRLAVENCIFVGNQARNGGAVTAWGQGWMEIASSTVAGNVAHDSGGAFSGDDQTQISVFNSIVWGNMPTVAGNQISMQVAYSDYQGGIVGDGNLNIDPLFADLENGDVSLQGGSPCIDAAMGDKAPEFDKMGFPRSDDPAVVNTGAGNPNYVDMGALEYNTCGNGAKEDYEACEGDDLGGMADCQDLGFVASGALSCTDVCTFDLSQCESACGNGTVEPDEACEGTALGGKSCIDLGFETEGDLACTDECQFDNSGCEASCGNGLVEPTEECEGNNLGGATCEDEGFRDGMLSCNDDCTFDYSECNEGCGNGRWEDFFAYGINDEFREECDGNDFGGQQCNFLGFSGGTLSCSDDCKIDTSNCFTECGNGMREEGEECDGPDLGWSEELDDYGNVIDSHPVTCRDVGFAADGELRCANDCTYETSGCFAQCGNELVEPKEDCEADDLQGATCEGLGFVSGGTLACAECQYDTSQCEAVCGNSAIEPGEACEVGDLDGNTCADFGYLAPEGLACSSCQFDVSACAAACGNGVTEPGETCDDGNAVAEDGCSDTCQKETGWQCLGQPSRCDACPDYHHGESCDQCVVLVDNSEDIATRDGKSWSTALNSIQLALDWADTLGDGCQVWIAAGRYNLFENNQSDVITLHDSSVIYGGFDGTEGLLSERSLVGEATKLDARHAQISTYQVDHVMEASYVSGVVLDGLTVLGGTSWGDGHGLRAEGSSITVRNCLFRPVGEGNMHDSGTNAIYSWNGNLEVVSSLFVSNGNTAITSDNTSLTLLHSTFTGNRPSAIRSWGETSFRVIGSIIFNNQDGSFDENAPTHVESSLVQGWIGGESNVEGDPLFADPAMGDFSLLPGSPCVDAANGNRAPETDMLGSPRYDHPDAENNGFGVPDYADIGAIESHLCGNGEIDAGETCDGENVDSATCGSIGYEQDGVITCSATCQLDTSVCESTCGNELVEPDETCEGEDLDGNTCESLGYAEGGTLACDASRCQLDTSGCAATCGNGQAEPGELCDGTDLADESCDSQGFMGGDLACKDDCTFDYSGCAEGCGNGEVDADIGEECDGADLDGAGCNWLGYSTGELACTDDCRFDASDCGYLCGNNEIEPGEECDGWEIGWVDEFDNNGNMIESRQKDCRDVGFASLGDLRCAIDCSFDISGCHPQCNNELVEPGEDCEVDQLGNATCVSLGFVNGGTLSCTDCQFDTSECVAECGNGVIEPGEACEGEDLDGNTCSDFGYVETAGLTCVSCQLDDTGCTAVCGNGIIEPGETCDDANTGAQDGCDASCQAEEDYQCLGEPSVCDNCEEYMHGEACDRCIVLVNSDESIETRDGMSWQTALGTIQEGLDRAQELGDGCEVWVASGTYHIFETSSNDTVTLHDNSALFGGFDGSERYRYERFVAENPTVISAMRQTMSGNGVSNVISVQGVQNAIVDGFVVESGRTWDRGDGLHMQGGSLTVRNCVFRPVEPNDAQAIYVYQGDLTLINSVVYNSTNNALTLDWASATVIHSTLYGDHNALINDYNSSNIRVVGSIVYTSNGGSNGIEAMGSVVVESSLVSGWFGGDNNVSGEPLFADPFTGDFNLQYGSPCIDAADGDQAPETDMYGYPRYDDPGSSNTGVGSPTYADMGAIERHRCGNGVRDTGEACEGLDVGGASCNTLGYAADGDVYCMPNCQMDTSACEAVCENGTAEPTEACDGEDLMDATCGSLGFTGGGTLSCVPGECEFDTSECLSECGNGVVEPNEACDGEDLDEQRCETQGFMHGELQCNQDCTFDYSSCNEGCGNGRTEQSEECDGTEFQWDCDHYGFGSGTVSCTEDCLIDPSDCHAECNNNRLEEGEECDGWVEGNCETYGYYGGGDIFCSPECQIDTSGCQSTCGDGRVEPDETCEPGILGDATCESLGYMAGGTLACTACELDPSSCQTECGNGTIEPGEKCEGTDLNGRTCQDLGYVAPDGLVCTSCQLDDSGCSAVCGNGVKEPGEACDDGNSDPNDGCDGSCQPETGWQCLGSPSACDPCPDYLHGDMCDGCVVLVDKESDASDPDGKSWSTAFSKIQDAIDVARVQGDTCDVWIADGTYYIHETDSNNSIMLENGVSLYGGFDGTESTLDQRNRIDAVTILDGGSESGGNNYVETIVRADWVDGVTLDGLTLRRARGNGLNAQNAWLSISNCAFKEMGYTGNWAHGIQVGNSEFTFENSIIADNGGHGLEGNNAILQFVNCTIAGNISKGIRLDNMSELTVANSIIFFNGQGSFELNGASSTVRYSDVENWGTSLGNISSDPLFVDFEGGDFRLSQDSPCLDRADGAVAPEADISGYPRYDDPVAENLGTGTPAYVDMGAFELGGCGNGQVDEGEACDGDAGDDDCQDAGYADSTPLSCRSDCRYDTSMCQAECGNTILEPGEYCEGTNVGDATCADLGYQAGGTLGCDAETCKYDDSQCLTECGNDIREPGEECDGEDKGPATCESLGFEGGGDMVTCNQDCTYNMDNCYNGCGNNMLDPGEECDGNQIDGGFTCPALGLCGESVCNDDCTVDNSGCTSC